MINSCNEEILPYQLKKMDMILKIMNVPKIFKQVSNHKISNTILVLILSYNFDFKDCRSVLTCLSKQSRELSYNSNMINVICHKPEKLTFEKAIIDLGATTSAKSYWDNSWHNPRLDSPRGFHNSTNERSTV